VESKTKLWKCSGIFLIATGIIHTIFGIIVGKYILFAILKSGIFDAIDIESSRELIFWFLICGVLIIALGHILHYYIQKEQKSAPKLLGYYLLGLSIIGCVVMPASGFWLFIPQSLIILLAKRQ